MPRPEKSEEAFRTISEVAHLLDVEPHVLRFWESKFKQIQPVKKVGGRRLYRPEDVRLITNIKKLLHEQGMTIKGVQKVLRNQGVQAVRTGDVLVSPMADKVTGANVNELDGVAGEAAHIINLRQTLQSVQEKLRKVRDLLP